MERKAFGELELVFPTEEYMEKVQDYLKEHFDCEEYILSGDGGLDEIKDYTRWLEKIRQDADVNSVKPGRVPSTQYLAIRKADQRVVGMIQIRHYLNEFLLKEGGHIGDGVRPSERNKGYATEMIRLALEECEKLNISKVLMTCNKENIPSRKSIENNGGIFENEVLASDGHITLRFWIEI